VGCVAKSYQFRDQIIIVSDVFLKCLNGHGTVLQVKPVPYGLLPEGRFGMWYSCRTDMLER